MNREFIHPRLADTLPGSTQVALVRVVEEAAEMAKEVAKALRFGLGNRYPADGPTNAEKILAEFGDIQGALVDAGLCELETDRIRRHLAELPTQIVSFGGPALSDPDIQVRYIERAAALKCVSGVSIGEGGPEAPRVGLEPTTTRLTGKRSFGQGEPTQADSDGAGGEQERSGPIPGGLAEQGVTEGVSVPPGDVR